MHELELDVASESLVPAAGKMKTKAYSGSHFPRILTAATKGDAARESTLPDQLWALSWASVSLFILLRPALSLPQKHIYGLFLWVYWKGFLCFEKTCRC